MSNIEIKRRNAGYVVTFVVAVAGIIGLAMGWGVFSIIYKNYHPVARWVLSLLTAALLEASITALTFYLVTAAANISEIIICVLGILYGVGICAANAQVHSTMMHGSALSGWQAAYFNYFNAAAVYGIIIIDVALLAFRPESRRMFKERERVNRIKDSADASKDRILQNAKFQDALDAVMAPVVFQETLREAGALQHFTANELKAIGSGATSGTGSTVDALPVKQIDDKSNVAQAAKKPGGYVNGKAENTLPN